MSYQHRLSLFWVWAANRGEVGVGVFLLWDGDGRSEAKGAEGLLNEDVSHAMEGGMNKLQGRTSVQIPERRET